MSRRQISLTPRTLTTVLFIVLIGVLIGAGAGCAGRVDLEKIALGTRVEVTRKDGGVVEGTLRARDDRAVQLGVGSATRSIPRDQIVGVELGNSGSTAVLAAARFREFSVPDGTELTARLDGAIGSDTSTVDDAVTATLTEAVVVEGVTVLPEGSVLIGAVTTADSSSKVKGRASLGVAFRSISVAGRDETYVLSARFLHTAASTKASDARKIAIPAAGGAIIGAIIGGKKGAGIGAIIGGGAGTAVVLTTSGPEVRLAKGTGLVVVLDDAIDVRVPIKR